MENFDHYKVAKELADELRKEKVDCFADGIIKAIEEGATGTEIFMALRWNIENLLKTTDYSYSESIKNKAKSLYEELNKALQ